MKQLKKQAMWITASTAMFASGLVAAESLAEQEKVSLQIEKPTISTTVRESFGKLDLNKNGYIESSESAAMPSLNKAFPDISKDGKLDVASFAAWQAKQK